MELIKGNLDKWGDIPWIGKFSIVEMSVLSNFICRFSAIPVTILISYFVDINKQILRFIWKGRRANNIEGEEKSCRIDSTQLQDLL